MEEMGHRSQGAKGLIAPCDVSWPCWLTAPLASIVKDGGFGKYVHHRELYPVDAPIVRPNRDTLYSFSNYSQVRLRLTAFGIAVRERSYINSLIAGGEGGIRTHGTVTRTTVFETAHH
jgi:hypothetical protein